MCYHVSLDVLLESEAYFFMNKGQCLIWLLDADPYYFSEYIATEFSLVRCNVHHEFASGYMY